VCRLRIYRAIRLQGRDRLVGSKPVAASIDGMAWQDHRSAGAWPLPIHNGG
jgi:hypothetical protein